MKTPKYREIVGELVVSTDAYGRYNQFTKNRPLVGIVSDTNRAGIVAIGRFTVSSGEWRRARLEDLLPFLEDGEQQVIDLFAKIMEARSVKS